MNASLIFKFFIVREFTSLSLKRESKSRSINSFSMFDRSMELHEILPSFVNSLDEGI